MTSYVYSGTYTLALYIEKLSGSLIILTSTFKANHGVRVERAETVQNAGSIFNYGIAMEYFYGHPGLTKNSRLTNQSGGYIGGVSFADLLLLLRC